MKLTGNICAIILGLLMVLALSNANLVRRRRSSSSSSSSSEEINPAADDSGNGGLQGMLEHIPFIGIYLSMGVQKGMDGWHYSQDLTNGAIGRVLGGAFPCTLDVDSFICTGVSTTSDISDLVESILSPIPGVMLPGGLKKIIVIFIDWSWAPTMDFLFGGVRR